MRKNNARWLAPAAAAALALSAAAAFAAPAQAGAPYSCDTTASGGSCGPYSSPVLGTAQTADVVQDEWNAGYSGGKIVSQELLANSISDWQVKADVTGDGAVMTGPEAQITPENWTGTINLPVPLADYSSITSSWNVTLPAGTGDDSEAAYDIWLGNSSQRQWSGDQEIMVWADNHGQQPAGTDTGRTWTDTSTGAAYEIWVATGSTTVGSDSIVTFAARSNAASGSVDLLSLFKFLEANGYTASSAGIDQVNFGFELCKTSGTTEDFTVNSFTLTAAGDGQNGAPGGSAPAPTPTATTPTAPAPTPTTATPTPPAPTPTAPSPSPTPTCRHHHHCSGTRTTALVAQAPGQHPLLPRVRVWPRGHCWLRT